MTEEQIRQIVRDEMDNNYNSGSPDVPYHTHNGTDSQSIPGTNIEGFQPVPYTTSQKYLNPDTGLFEYGFASINTLSAGNTAGHMAQYVINQGAAINPIPIVVGNGVGVQGAFNGGYAPDGTVVLFETGAASTSYLYVRSRGVWFGFLADTTI